MSNSALKQPFKATITLLSPLHIGSGRELQRDFDYVTHGGKTWVIEPAALLERLVDAQGNLDARLVGVPASQLLGTQDYVESSPIFRYVLPNQPRAQDMGAVLREQYKDAFDRPYIPGSSLKGSLRTILTWHGYRSNNFSLDVKSLGEVRSWAGQPIERALFGPNPNFDLLRGLHVADSVPQATSTMRIANGQVVTGSDKPGTPIELEAVWTNTVFETKITLDSYLNSQSAAKLGFADRWAWLSGLPEIAQAWAAERLGRERTWFAERKYDAVTQLYTQMLGILNAKQLGPNRFFVNLGWGGGWGAKTIGAPLQKAAEPWEQLLADRRRTPARFERRPGDPFPKSRRVLVVGNKVMAPFGWCLVELKQVN